MTTNCDGGKQPEREASSILEQLSLTNFFKDPPKSLLNSQLKSTSRLYDLEESEVKIYFHNQESYEFTYYTPNQIIELKEREQSLGYQNEDWSSIQRCSKVKPNSLKNFVRNFVKWLQNEEDAKNAFTRIANKNDRTLKFQKIVERLKKKIKNDGQKHTVEHLKSLLIYKDQENTIYTRYLMEMCEKFVALYPQKIVQSPRMGPTTINDNLAVINVVRLLLEKELRYLQANASQ